MDVRVFGLENPVVSTLHHLMNMSDEIEKGMGAPTRTFVQDARAIASTPADIKELPSAYAFIVDMPGVKSADIKVQVEDDRVLAITGERRRGPSGKEDGGKYLLMERRVGKFMRKFALPDNANVDAISAVCQNGVLTVTVQKVLPPEPKKPKTVEVRVS